MAKNRVIGLKGKMPWYIPDEIKLFRKMTQGHLLIMGRTTFESIGSALPDITTIIVSATLSQDETSGYLVARSLEAALALGRSMQFEQSFICGGTRLYEEGLQLADYIYLMTLHFPVPVRGDTYFPLFDHNKYKKIQTDLIKSEPNFNFEIYERKKLSF